MEMRPVFGRRRIQTKFVGNVDKLENTSCIWEKKNSKQIY